MCHAGGVVTRRLEPCTPRTPDPGLGPRFTHTRRRLVHAVRQHVLGGPEPVCDVCGQAIAPESVIGALVSDSSVVDEFDPEASRRSGHPRPPCGTHARAAPAAAGLERDPLRLGLFPAHRPAPHAGRQRVRRRDDPCCETGRRDRPALSWVVEQAQGRNPLPHDVPVHQATGTTTAQRRRATRRDARPARVRAFAERLPCPSTGGDR